MTLDEFRKLKTGDRICNPMSRSRGKVESAEDYRSGHIVSVRWDGASIVFGSFSEMSTTWMHWTKETTYE
jgi:hypothetical protein